MNPLPKEYTHSGDSNNFSFQILKTISHANGLRFIIVDIKTESKTLTLENMYAPNNDDPFFLENVFKHFPKHMKNPCKKWSISLTP